MSDAPPPPPFSYDPRDPHDPRVRDLPVPQPGWIPGTELPGAERAAPGSTHAPHGAPAAPSWPASPSWPGAPGPAAAGGFGQPPAPPARRRPGWLVPAALGAAAVVIALVVVLLTRGDEDTGLATSRATSSLSAALEDVDLPEGGSSVLLERCRGFDLDAVAELAPAGFDTDTALAGTEGGQVFRLGERSRDPLFLECVVVDELAGVGFSAYAAEAPSGDYTEYLERVTFVEQEEPVPFEGGTMHPFCFVDEAGIDNCQTFWHDERIQVGIWAKGAEVTAETTTDWLQAALRGILTELATLDPDDIAVAG